MKTRYISGILFTALFTVSAFLLPQASQAGVEVVRPEMFRPLNPVQSVLITPAYIASGSESGAQLTAPLKLPVGATIRKMVFYHWSMAIGGTTSVALVRTKIGASFDNADSILLVAVAQNEINFPSQPPLMIENLTPNPAADLTVRKGYRYFLLANCSSITQAISGVKVSYH